MKQRAFKEQVFKLLFRAEFNTKEELLEQLGKMPIGDPAREKIVEELNDYSRIVEDYLG